MSFVYSPPVAQRAGRDCVVSCRVEEQTLLVQQVDIAAGISKWDPRWMRVRGVAGRCEVLTGM